MQYIYDPMIIKLKLEKKKVNPAIAVMTALGCSYKTAYNRLRDAKAFTRKEALRIKEAYFSEDGVSLEELFARELCVKRRNRNGGTSND